MSDGYPNSAPSAARFARPFFGAVFGDLIRQSWEQLNEDSRVSGETIAGGGGGCRAAGQVAKTADEAAQAFEKLGGKLAVVKSQIHAGGRGKGRFKEYPDQAGVVLVKSAAEARQNAARMLGKTLVTKQTGPAGKTVNVLLVEEGLAIARELYLGVVVDRGVGGPVLIMSSEGGTEIEEVAARAPDKILSEPVDAGYGLFGFPGHEAGLQAGAAAPTPSRSAEKFLPQMVRFFLDNDCSLAEINPLVVTEAGDVLALDGKLNFDDNALFRHKPLEPLRDVTEEDPAELRAANAGLSYVNLDGNIGCLVNGAGLAMSTMDLIKYHGGEPANFLDVGGGAKNDQVTEAFRILLADKHVQGGAGQHLRRHHEVRHDRRSAPGRRTRRSASTCRWSCGSKGPTSRRPARCWRRAAGRSSPRPT